MDSLRCLRWVVTAIVVLLAAGACSGDDGSDAVVAQGVPTARGAVAATAPTIADTAVTGGAVATTAAAATTSPLDAFPPSTTSTEDPHAQDPVPAVSADDPLPPQADAGADPAAAEVAVRYAFGHWILLDLDPDVRARLVEGGEARRDELQAGILANRTQIEFARFVVDEVRFASPTEAAVVFRIRWRDAPSPYFPDALIGRAVFADGTWRVAADTSCRLALGTGQPCNSSAADPVPTAALVTTAFPIPMERQDSGLAPDAAEISVPAAGEVSVATWAASDRRQATVRVTVRYVRGLARLGADDETAFADGFTAPGVQAITVAGAPARIVSDSGGDVRLRWVRPDDVVVQIDAEGLAVSEVVEFATGVHTAGA